VWTMSRPLTPLPNSPKVAVETWAEVWESILSKPQKNRVETA